jgi:predicted small integral membrane protein
MTLRLLKSILVLAIGLWALLVAADNLLDYEPNLHFVQHVLSMDTVLPDNALKYRAITNPVLETFAYSSIIAVECAIGILCVAGAWRLFRARHDRRAFIAAKSLAASGLALLFLLYFVGFVTVGGEWFSMWQSQIWNGQAKSVMFITCAMFVMVVLLLPEESDKP